VGPPRLGHQGRALTRRQAPVVRRGEPPLTTPRTEDVAMRSGGDPVGRASCMGSGDEPSAISTASLNPLPGVHAPPINQLVLLGPYPIDSVGILIFRRASRLDAFSGYPCRTSATQRCPWRDNWYTGGPSVPVLSY
jgi:hypothetical protein